MLLFPALVLLLLPSPALLTSASAQNPQTGDWPSGSRKASKLLSAVSSSKTTNQTPLSSLEPARDPPSSDEPSRPVNQRAARDTGSAPAQQTIRVLVSDTCVQKDAASGADEQGKELDLEPGSPLVLTHRISLVPGPGVCGGCEAQFAALRERLERLEREVSALREKCGGPEGGCCTSQQSTGAHCTIDPSGASCPNDCSDQGRQCDTGFTGADCNIALTAVTQLSSRDITDSSVTVFWTPPSVQYETYLITFTSQKEGDQKITSKVGGQLTSYTQTGLAAGQEYTVSIRGEIDGKVGAESTTEFTTLISGPKNLHVVKTTTTSVVVQWERPLGDIDRYRLSVSPNQTEGGEAKGSQKMTLPPKRDSAHIENLEPGRLYDITLVAEKERSQSPPVTVQVTPDTEVTMETVTMTMGSDSDKRQWKPKGKVKPDRPIFYKKYKDDEKEQKKGDGRLASGKKVEVDPHRDSETSPEYPPSVPSALAPDTRPQRPQTRPGRPGIEDQGSPGAVSTVTEPGLGRGDSTEVVILGKDGDKKQGRGREAPEGLYRNFTVICREQGGRNGTETKEEEDDSEQDDDDEEEDEEEGDEERKAGVSSTQDKRAKDPSRGETDAPRKSTESGLVSGGTSGRRKAPKFSQVLPGSARSLPFRNLHPQTPYFLSLFGTGPGLRSKIHQLDVITGPEPPSNLLFGNVTESSLTVSWTKPRGPVTGFKVTYTHTQEGEPVSVSVDSQHSMVLLSQLSPGSPYEVSVISLLGMDESDPIKGLVVTVPDPPTDLRAINVTDTKALLLWRPALATVDRYIIVYGSEKGQDVRISVSGNAAEQQLKSLQGSTVYSVTIRSQLGDQQSGATTTIFTTTGGIDERGREGPRDLTASNVTPRSAVLSWRPPPVPVTGYRLTYQTAGEEMKEVTLDPSVTQHTLTGLFPTSKYTVRLQGERRGQYTAAISTEFTTGSLRYPFPSDCSQELLNGVQESGEAEIFPGGRQGGPMRVYCDMETDGGGWTVFQRRMNGRTNFFRSWRDYSSGFGNLSAEFWLGNELLHNLTSQVAMALRVDLRTGAESVYAHYSSFSVDTQRRHYALRVSGYSGTAGDSMGYHNGRPFSTRDRDPNPFITRCAMSYRGGWWYKNCHEANLNGLYNVHTNHQGVIWMSWKGKDFSIPFTEMKLRPVSFSPPYQG
ncbi:hypothetical protein MATL_G00228580 [Megalops atlanticus]|uniref:Uncharacterized protein n=1 Tax=Megalops atlanticus TaxID=7932 RepID=A0A9D3PEM9_MEGAT|nr:hypothetical protein MATL_G00228580 [Megalops atlanticus]